jgi:DNA polymerase theta
MFASSVIHTATGRISMHEPNLQNIPRDFEIVIDETKAEVPTSISMRLAFVPGRGKMYVCVCVCVRNKNSILLLQIVVNRVSEVFLF